MPRALVESITTDELCSYGCGQVAKFINKSKRLMCCNNTNACPDLRKRNTMSVLKAYETGKRKPAKELYQDLSQEKKDKMNWNKGKNYADFSYGGGGGHKKALIKERGYRCENCTLSEWMGQPITLELEHVDGDRKNNTRENLKLLCPNCHSLTLTWKVGRNGNGWNTNKYSDEEYIDAIQNSYSLTQLLKKLDLRYGCAKKVIDIMIKYKINFKQYE